MSTLKELQKQQKELLKGIEHPRLGDILALYEELGELSKEVMEIEMYGESKKQELADECADVFSSLLAFCESYEIDLEDAYLKKMKEIKEKVPGWHEKYGEKLKELRNKFD